MMGRLFLLLGLLLVVANPASCQQQAHDNNEFASSSSSLSTTTTTTSLPTNENANPSNTEDATTSSTTTTLFRHLALGDFASFNEAIADLRLEVEPPAPISTQILFELVISLSNVYCQDIHLGDMQGSYETNNVTTTPTTTTTNTNVTAAELVYSLTVNPFDITCYADYSYTYGFLFSGSGVLTLKMSSSVLQMDFGFASAGSSFELDPPNSTTVQECNTAVNIDSVELDRGLEAVIVNVFQGLVADALEGQVATAICDAVAPAYGLLNSMLEAVNSQLDKYLQPAADDAAAVVVVDPLQVEKDFVPPADANVLHLLDDNDNDRVTSLLREIIGQADEFLSQMIDDPMNPGTQDLAINVFLRNNLLDPDDGSFTIDTSAETEGILSEGEDNFVRTRFKLESIKIQGLDSFQNFMPLEDIGNYTLANAFSWEFLNVEVDVLVDIGISTLPDAQLTSPTEIQTSERVHVQFDLSDLDVGTAFFLAIDQAKLNAFRVGRLLQLEDIFSCLFEILVDMAIANLDVSVGDIGDPSFTGFASPGFDRIVSSIVEAAFIMYRPTFLRVIPAAFAGDVRKMFNEKFIDETLKESTCPEPTIPDPFLDFRDLFLEPSAAKELGGSGEGQYGNLGQLAYSIFTNEMTYPDEDGLASINGLLLRPLTRDQSGTTGTLKIASDLLGTPDKLDLMGSKLALQLDNLRLENLDTVGLPLDLLLPTDDAVVLNNRLTAGLADRPISFAMNLGLDLEGDLVQDGGISQNKILIKSSLESFQLKAAIGAWISTARLLDLPLEHLFSVECWVATMERPSTAQSEEYNYALRIALMELATSAWNMDIACTNESSCDMEGLVRLPTTLENLAFVDRVNDVKDGLEALMSEIAVSDFMSHVLDGLINDAHKACPAFMDTPSVRQSLQAPLLPELTQPALESLAATGVFAVELLWVVISETYSGAVLTETDPLSPQEALILDSDGGDLLDFSNLSDALGEPFEWLWDEALKYLSGNVKDPDATDGSKDLGVNILLRALPLDGDGKFSVDIDTRLLGDDNLGISLRSMRIDGLSSLTEFDIADTIGPQTLSNKLTWQDLDLELDLMIGSESSPDEQVEVSVSLGLSNVSTAMALFLAIDKNGMGDIEFGQLLDTSSILPCILSAARAAEVSQLDMSVGAIKYLEITGFSDETTADAARNMTSTLVEKYSDTLTSAVKPFFGVTMRALLNSWLSNLLEDGTEKSCSRAGTGFPGAFVDFRDLLLSKEEAVRFGGAGDGRYGDLFSLVWNFIDTELFSVDESTGLAAINSMVITPLTKEQSGTPGKFLLSGDVLNGEQRVDLFQTGIRFRLYDLFVENIDTFGTPLSLLAPVEGEARVLNNEVTIGMAKPLKLGAKVSFGLSGGDVSNDLEITVKIDGLSLALKVLLKLIEESFLQFPLRDVDNFNCWLAMLPIPSLDNNGVRTAGSETPFDFLSHSKSFGDLDLNVTCLECSSPSLPNITELLSTPKGNKDASDVVDEILDWAVDIFGADYLKYMGDRLIVDSRLRCPHHPSYDPSAAARDYDPFQQAQNDDSIGLLIAFAAVAAVLILSVGTILLVVRFIVHRRHRKWLATLSEQKVLRLWHVQEKTKEMETQVDESTLSLFASPEVPMLVRLAMPLIILGNIGLFLSGHLSNAASVTVFVSFAGDTFYQEDFFTFSIAKGTVNIWKGGGRELAVLILMFSGVWPYTKQIISFVCWFLPTNMLSTKRRGSIFRWLDALAKWSMIDIFTILISLVAFHISAKSPEVGFLPSDFYNLDLLVIPKLGLYANFTAQIISQVSSHFIIHYHDKVVEKAHRRSSFAVQEQPTVIDESSEENGEQVAYVSDEVEESLASHAFFRPHRGENDRLVVRAAAIPLLLFASVVLSVLVVLGCSLPSFSLNLLGIVGVLIELGQNMEEAYMDFSLFTMVKTLFQQADFTNRVADYVGLGSLGGLMILTVLIAPLIQTGVLLYLWLCPMTQKKKKRMIIVNETLQAWQYAEVYALAIIFGSWQLGSISEFMVNTYCDQQPELKEAFGFLAFFRVIDQSDAQCFRVQSDIEIGFYFIAAATLLLAFVNTFIKRAADQYLHDKTEVPSLQQHHGDADKTAVAEKVRGQIAPPPMLFSDRFRWFLIRQDSAAPSLQIFASFSNSNSVNSGLGDREGVSEELSSSSPSDVEEKAIDNNKMVDTLMDPEKSVREDPSSDTSGPPSYIEDDMMEDVAPVGIWSGKFQCDVPGGCMAPDEEDEVDQQDDSMNNVPVNGSPIRMAKTWSETSYTYEPANNDVGLKTSPSADDVFVRDRSHGRSESGGWPPSFDEMYA